MKIEFVYNFFCLYKFGRLLERRALASVGGTPSAHLRLWGLPWTRYYRRNLAHPLQSTMFKNLDNTPFAYSLFCFKIDLLKLEMMSLLSKHDSIQRDQLE
jgi:hypothetical protein